MITPDKPTGPSEAAVGPDGSASGADPGAREVPAGFLVVDKPVGPSSMKAVAAVRRRVAAWVRPTGLEPKRKIRVGHAGTLDPLASGVLVMGVGAATRRLEAVMAGAKQYRTEVDLSAFTPTDDAEGEREPVDVAAPPPKSAVRDAVAGFEGTIDQRPPAFSAVKVGGRRAYAVARGGGAPEIASRPVDVHAIELIQYEWPVATVEIRSGKGFYVRSFARDLGIRLGTGGTCLSIRRTAVEPFMIDESIALDDLPEQLGPSALIPLERFGEA